ncbi:MAG TPA: dihydrofolate reductase family protein [Kofleriaceae bacterium]|jgi:dihydrofolate reductase
MSKRKLMVFDQVTLDGYFTGEGGDLSWAHASQDAQWKEFSAQNARGEAVFLMGRVTYEMMSSYWPTPEAAKQMPVVAEAMNRNQKIVFSRTLDKPSWNNTRVVKQDLAAEVRRLKDESGPPLLIMYAPG